MENTNVVAVNTEVTPFDYAEVDQDTAVFLKERAKKIIDVRMRSILAIGKELKAAHERLANHKNGTFIAWCNSIGFKKDTAYNYIRAHGYVVENIDNINDPEKIQQSLLFAISKPSAPQELQDKVLSGDIKTHKEYQELLAQYNDALTGKRQEQEKRSEAEADLRTKDQVLRDTQADVKMLQDELRKKKTEAQEEIDRLHKHLEQAKVIGYPERIQELEAELAELKSRPVDVAVKETIPSKIKDAIMWKIADILDSIRQLNDVEIQIYKDSGRPVQYADEAIHVLSQLKNN